MYDVRVLLKNEKDKLPRFQIVLRVGECFQNILYFETLPLYWGWVDSEPGAIFSLRRISSNRLKSWPFLNTFGNQRSGWATQHQNKYWKICCINLRPLGLSTFQSTREFFESKLKVWECLDFQTVLTAGVRLHYQNWTDTSFENAILTPAPNAGSLTMEH